MDPHDGAATDTAAQPHAHRGVAGTLKGGTQPITLKRGALSQLDVVAQSVALGAPSAVVGSEIVLVVAIAGRSSWLAWALGIVMFLFVGVALSQLALRFSSTGGIYSLAGCAAGPTAGYAVGIGILIAYLVSAPALVFQFAWFTSGYLHLHAFGVPDTHLTALIVGFLGLLGAGFCSYIGAAFSARAMLIAELGSVSAIVVLLLIILGTHHGSVFNHALLSLHGLSFHTLLLAAPLVLFAAAGFESSAVLGEEARNPRRSIPVAMVGSISIIGLFLVACSYILVLAFQGTHFNIVNSTNVLSGAASISGVSWYGYIVGVGVMISMFSVMIAIYNASARLLYTLSRERLMPGAFGYSHPRHRTPSKAVLFIGVANAVGLVIVVACSRNVLNAFGDLATLSGYGFTFMYAAALVAVAVCFGRRLRERRAGLTVVVAIVPLIPLGYVFYTYFHPLPGYPTDVYLWVFVGALVAASAIYFWLRLRVPEAWTRVGSVAVSVPRNDEALREDGIPVTAETGHTPPLA